MKTYGINIIDEFLIEKIGNEGLSRYSIRTYTSAFNLLLTCDYIDINDPKTFTEINFKRFLLESLNKYEWNSKTYNIKRMAFKVLSDYLQKRGLLAENPFKEIRKRKEEKALPKYLNTEQVSILLEAVESVFAGNSFLQVRNRTIFYFFLFTGLRLAELRNMKLEDIDFAKGQINVIRGKGNKDRAVPLVNALRKKLDDYLQTRKAFFGNRKYAFLFSSKMGNILREHDMYIFFNKVNQKLPFHITPHMLRHTYATELLRQGVHLYKISKILGHTDLKTTQVYLGLDNNDIIDDLNSKVLFAY